MNYVTQKLELYRTNASREFDNFGDFVVRFGEAEKYSVPVAVREPLRVELEDFVEAVVQDRAPKVEGAVGISVLQVIERITNILAEGNNLS